MNATRDSSLFSSLGTSQGATAVTITFIVLLAIVLLIQVTKLPFIQLLRNFLGFIMRIFGKFINKKEKTYHRDLEIGKINEKRMKVKLYSFLNDLIIDLGLNQSGITPYELLTLTVLSVSLITLLACKILLGSFAIAFLLGPITIVGTFCVMYTRANIAHDSRIEAVIEAENIICNNIKVGVVVAVRESLDVLPKEVRQDFKDFLDNIEQENYHIRTALLELNKSLGGIADDFIKKCIVFEMEEEHGIAGMFQDIVEINNIKSESRIEMKRRFEEVSNQFRIGAVMIFVFLAGVLWVYPDVRHWYFNTALGQFVIAIDVLLFILEYVYMTYLKAKEL